MYRQNYVTKGEFSLTMLRRTIKVSYTYLGYIILVAMDRSVTDLVLALASLFVGLRQV